MERRVPIFPAKEQGEDEERRLCVGLYTHRFIKTLFLSVLTRLGWTHVYLHIPTDEKPKRWRCLRECECDIVMTMAMANSISSGFNSMKVWKAIEHPKRNEPKFISSLGFGKSRAFRTKCDYSCFEVKDVSYQPPGTELSLLNAVTFCLPEKSFGLIFGQSGSGKTTLLQLLAGLSRPTSGSIFIQRYGNDGNPNQSPEPLPSERVGIVFQFPERYFVADNVLDEVIFGWPRQKGDMQLKEHLALRLQRAINWVGLNGILLDKDPHSLSGGYKRRLALAIQLVEIPDLLILDEPLAGLDWKARADVVKLLKHLKKELTILVVSHDLKELAPLVDRSWRMEMGGILREELLPVQFHDFGFASSKSEAP